MIAIISDPKATVPRWYRVKFRKLPAIGHPSWCLFLEKNHLATEPATTMCWQPTINCEIQNSVTTLYHLVTNMEESFTYFALVLFSIVNRPELSIQIAKYSQRLTITASATSVCNRECNSSYYQ